MRHEQVELSKYVPGPLARRFQGDPRAPVDAEFDSLTGAAVMADIADFTTVANRLARRGAVGSEVLTSLVNEYFAQLHAIIRTHGGEVVTFAGDALIAVWLVEDPDALRSAVLAATACALAIQGELDGYGASDEDSLTLRVGVGAGAMAGVHVGGIDDKWFYVLTGDAVLQAVGAVLTGEPGDVVASAAVVGAAGDDLVGIPIGDGQVRVVSAVGGTPTAPTGPAEIDAVAWGPLQRYLPDQVRHAVLAGQSDWLAESRHVCVLFIKLLDFVPTAPDALETAQAAMLAVQRVFVRLDGYIDQLLVDDKGAVIVGVFGARPQAHEDDALRGVETALEVHRSLNALHQRSGIGVATGRAFVGPVGGHERRTYTVMGEQMNLAARLMSRAGDGILCDRATVAAAGHCADFSEPVTVDLKGWADGVPVYTPLTVDRRRSRPVGDGSRLAGRHREIAAIGAALEDVGAGRSRLLVIEGEPGVGKSRLVAHLLGEAARRGLVSVVAEADGVQQSTPYFPWRRCLTSLTGMDQAAEWSAEARREYVLARLGSDRVPRNLAPLLSGVLPVEFEDTVETRDMIGEDRAYATRQLLAGLFDAETTHLRSRDARPEGTVLVLEDAHWFDSSSWDVVREICHTVSPILVVVATRPTGSDGSGLDWALDGWDAELLRLDALTREETAQLLCDRLGVDSIPDQLLSIVMDRAEGNPFFSEELVMALLEAGLFEVTDGTCQLTSDDDFLRHIAFPDTLHGVVTSRIDRLATTEQLTIKVAAVIGRVFGYLMLGEVHPTADPGEALRSELENLRRLDLTPLQHDEPDLAYLFKHVIIQEVAYSLLPTAQRGQLHRAAAEFLERMHQSDLGSVARSLAHHWASAGDQAKAMSWYALAGRDALRKGAYRESVEAFEQALGLAASVSEPPDVETVVDWEVGLGEGYDGLSEHDQSAAHFERALELLGRPLPRSTVGWLAMLIRGVLGQAATFAFRRRRIGRDPITPAKQDIADCLRRILLVYYHRNERLTCLAIAVAGLNLAESVDDRLHRAQFYASCGPGAGVMGLPRLGEWYIEAAIRLVADLDDPATTTWVRQTAAWFYCGMGGQWERAQSLIDSALDVAQGAGLRRIFDEELQVRAVSRWPEPFPRRMELWARAQASGAERGDREVEIWSRGIGAGPVLTSGRTEEAIALLEPAVAMFRPESSRSGHVKVYGTLCLAYLRAGRRDDAIAALHRALQAGDEALPILVSMFDGYANTVEACLELWASGDTEWRRPARRSLKHLKKLARPFPVARPRALFCAGRIQLLDGHPHRARRLWKRSLDLAAHLGLPYEIARCHVELGLLDRAGGDEEAAGRHLDEARAIFVRLEAGFDLARIDAST